MYNNLAPVCRACICHLLSIVGRCVVHDKNTLCLVLAIDHNAVEAAQYNLRNNCIYYSLEELGKDDPILSIREQYLTPLASMEPRNLD